MLNSIKIDYVKIGELREYSSNPKIHEEKQIQQIAKSIERFGFNNPILVDERSEVIAGHGRLLAARLLKLEAVPVVRLIHLSEAEKRAYRIADNKLSENGRWDTDLLKLEFSEIEKLALNFEDELNLDITGFDFKEIDVLLAEDRPNKKADEKLNSVPYVPENEIVSQHGDVWLLGKHKVICVDARQEETYQRLFEDVKANNRVYDDGKSYGLIVDYIGIFDNVAKALDFDEASMRKVITNIEEVKEQFPALLRKCLSYFMGVDRSVDGWEGLMAAQEKLPTNKEKDAFAADYRVLNRVWNALSPDSFLAPYKTDYLWLSKVYESVKPTDNRGGLIWATLGHKTMELVHANLDVGEVHDDMDILHMDAELIDDFIEKQKDIKKTTMRVEIDLVAKIRKYSDDPKFVQLGEKLESLREKHERGLVTSIEFLKLLLELAKEAAQAEKEVVPEEEVDKGKAALTELFNGVKNAQTPVIVERIVNDIDDIVKYVRFPDWQDTTTGKQEIKKALAALYNLYCFFLSILLKIFYFLLRCHYHKAIEDLECYSSCFYPDRI